MSGGARLEDIFSQIQAGETATLNLIVKADVTGSLEAVTESLRKLERDEVKLAFVLRGVGGISQYDVQLAAASNATILGFNVRPDRNARELADAERVEIRQDGRVVAEHERAFGRDQTVFDPWHYVPVLARKPGALRNGAPFKDWVLPAALDRVRRKLAGSAGGDRQMVEILTAVLADGLPAVEAACAEALREGVHSADVVLNILARQREPTAPVTILTPESLRLRHEPVADCARYDSLRSPP